MLHGITYTVQARISKNTFIGEDVTKYTISDRRSLM